MMQALRHGWNRFLNRRLNDRLIRRILAFKTRPQFERHYGGFRCDEDFTPYAIPSPENESGIIRGEVVRLIQEIAPPPGNLLLPGEPNAVKALYARTFGLDAARITTAGLHPDMDLRWDYEQDPPTGIGRYDCVVSQAMIEHLIDPYRHVRDLAGLVGPGGRLIVHTVLPGFTYHRHPVDCLRFFPDWFEEVAKRLGLAVEDKVIRDGHIIYKYRRPL